MAVPTASGVSFDEMKAAARRRAPPNEVVIAHLQ
jgi:hypothetical protein